MQDEVHHARSLGLSVALGGAMGAAIGAATGHMGVWVAAGIAVYIAISIVGGAWKTRSQLTSALTENRNRQLRTYEVTYGITGARFHISSGQSQRPDRSGRGPGKDD